MDEEPITVRVTERDGPIPDPSHYLTFEDADLEGESFSGRRLRGFGAVASRFRRCSFEDLRVGDATFGAGLRMSYYEDCSFDGSWLRGSAPGSARFERCSFRDVRLEGWFCFELELVDCVFSGRAKRMVFNGAVPNDAQKALGRTKNEIRGNDFSEMRFDDVGFRTGVDLTAQKLPLGEAGLVVTDGQRVVTEARTRVLAWDAGQERDVMLRHLDYEQSLIDGGQQQLMLLPPLDERAPVGATALLAEVARSLAG